MKVVVAMDSFKGSIKSVDAARFVKSGILSVYKDAVVDAVTVSDGGEGFLSSLSRSMDAISRTISVMNPMGDEATAEYGIVAESGTAIIEAAQAIGLNLVPPSKLNPMVATSYGVGELILDAIDQGCKKFIVGLGGSATNDGGMGMLQALGYEFVDKKGKVLGLGAGFLSSIETIKTTGADPRLKECQFTVAWDVDAPLIGSKGATHVYGPQKGASPAMIKDLEGGMVKYAEIIKRSFNKMVGMVPGAGAAGGLGYAFLAFLNTKMESGSKVVEESIKLEDLIRDCDVVITGEGKLDAQTSKGKVPSSVAKLAKQYNKLVVALAGIVDDDIQGCLDDGIDAAFCVQRGPIDISDAMGALTIGNNLTATTAQVFRLINCASDTAFGLVKKTRTAPSTPRKPKTKQEPEEPTLDEELSGDSAIFNNMKPEKPTVKVDEKLAGDGAIFGL